MKEFKIISLNIGMPKKLKIGDKEYISGVGKEPVEKAFLSKEGFTNDGVQLTKVHGGPDRAVLFYCSDHYETWNEEFGKELLIPGFGENITISGLPETEVYIGDVFQVGEAVVEISQPRNPCNTLSKYNDEDDLLSKMIEKGFTGYLGRVVQEGLIQVDSSVSLLERKMNSVSVSYSNEVYFHDRNNVEGIKKLLDVEELSDAWRDTLTKRLQTLETN
ncbi:MOSC domain-containing protein [Bacillus sp. DJP31]|uniref:MOSC domain-containing protein n=1 Tax=Bacillus sp. DJP31 TaxID=3409789 RepID=UPI003BB5D728